MHRSANWKKVGCLAHTKPWAQEIGKLPLLSRAHCSGNATRSSHVCETLPGAPPLSEDRRGHKAPTTTLSLSETLLFYAQWPIPPMRNTPREPPRVPRSSSGPSRDVTERNFEAHASILDRHPDVAPRHVQIEPGPITGSNLDKHRQISRSELVSTTAPKHFTEPPFDRTVHVN